MNHKAFYSVCFLALILFINKPVAYGQSDKKDISLEDIWLKGTFFARGIDGGKSMADGQHYTLLESSREGVSIKKYKYSDGKEVAELLNTQEESNKALKSFNQYEFSKDEKQILIATETEALYRHSSKSFFYIYDVAQKSFKPVYPTAKQSLAGFSPDGKRVAFVVENNLYIMEVGTGNTQQITQDGEFNKIINGASDWVYEEEFGFDKAYQWSPDGKHLAYYRFDESEVPEFSMDMFGKDLYPTQSRFKYPKAGEANAKVAIFIYDLDKKAAIPVDIPRDYEYIPRIKWTSDAGQLCVYVMNRHQNELELYTVSAQNGQASLLFKETDNAYVDINDDIRFLRGGDFIWTSERDGYNHLYLIQNRGKRITQITKGNWDVTKFYGIDASGKTLYFQASVKHPSNTEVYSIGINGRGMKNLTPQEGSNSANFSSTFAYFIHTHSASAVPATYVLRDRNGKAVRTLRDNEASAKKIQEYKVAPAEFMGIDTEDGVNLKAWVIKPYNFDPNKKYPLLMHVYGGPGAQTVVNRYDPANFFWHQMMANMGFLVVSVDNRGTGHRGRDFKKATYLQLGKLEIEDQIAAAQWFAKKDYVDANRIGMWGWSFGGYLSSLAITKGAEIFSFAIAVAPVTSWRFYDSIYTERYLRTPQENASGYDDNSPLNFTKKIKGKYLLIHGTADDNVHYQNAMRMVDELVNANIDFDMMMYPDKNHGIYGGYTRYHLYKKMTDFLKQQL